MVESVDSVDIAYTLEFIRKIWLESWANLAKVRKTHLECNISLTSIRPSLRISTGYWDREKSVDSTMFIFEHEIQNNEKTSSVLIRKTATAKQCAKVTCYTPWSCWDYVIWTNIAALFLYNIKFHRVTFETFSWKIRTRQCDENVSRFFEKLSMQWSQKLTQWLLVESWQLNNLLTKMQTIHPNLIIKGWVLQESMGGLVSL